VKETGKSAGHGRAFSDTGGPKHTQLLASCRQSETIDGDLHTAYVGNDSVDFPLLRAE